MNKFNRQVIEIVEAVGGQINAAKMIGVSQSTISAWINGSPPRSRSTVMMVEAVLRHITKERNQ